MSTGGVCLPPIINLAKLAAGTLNAYYGGGNVDKKLIAMYTHLAEESNTSNNRKATLKIDSWLHLNDLIMYGTERPLEKVDYDADIGPTKNRAVIVKRGYGGSIIYEPEANLMSELNTLRQYLPNFVLLLASFQCADLPIGYRRQFDQPYDPDVQKINPICGNTGAPIDYLLLENPIYMSHQRDITNMSLWMFFMKREYRGSFPAILQILSQVLLALHVAQTTLGFTHYNLSTETVNLRRLCKFTDAGRRGVQGEVEWDDALLTYPLKPADAQILLYAFKTDPAKLPDYPGKPGYKLVSVRSQLIAVISDFKFSRTNQSQRGDVPEETKLRKHFRSMHEQKGITKHFSGIYDAFSLIADVNSMLISMYQDNRLEPLYTALRSRCQYFATEPGFENSRLGVDPQGMPETCGGDIGPLHVIKFMTQMFPKEMRDILLKMDYANDLIIPSTKGVAEVDEICKQI